ncbi:MAG: 23S rRNA (adenine(2503)-C(2))-methyltransferase RlmN, partial [Thermoanaerobaculia bacterium]
LEDGERVETVKMPMEKNYTFCLSTQTGCPLKCVFCLTGQRTGRNLKPYEIFGTFLGMAKGMEAKRINVVFMGMGEPLLNLENIKKVLPFFYISIAPRRITISTAGILDKIKELGKIEPHPRLAISLNAGSDQTRKKLMPFVNYKINELIEEIKNYPKRTGEKVTLEYVLLKDINDTFEEIKALSESLNPIKKLIKINFIPFNQVPELQFLPPEERKINEILDYLSKKGFHLTVRRSKGRDISAACGQLRAEYSENI